jgi:predicted aconitase
MSPLTADGSSLSLTDEERAMLAGEAGEAVRLAMRIVTRLAPLYGATSLLPVTRAHIDGCIYQGEVGLAFAERLAELGGRVRVPTTLNVVSLDRRHWRAHGLDADYADKAYRLGNAYVRMGAQPTFTCAPYQTAAVPAFGEQIAWAESNAVAYANSVLGARTNRYGDFLDACCALTGRVPAAGLHLDEPRLGRVLVRLRDLPEGLTSRDDFYPVLGYLLGTLVADEPPVVEGLDLRPTDDQLKALAAAAATSGAIALFHLVGITPEASTCEAAFGGRSPERVIEVDLSRLRQARRELSTGQHRDRKLDVVAFGSPHCSLAECREIAALVDGRRAAPDVEVFVTTSRAVRDLLERGGDLDRLTRFGAKVTADTCIVVSPLVRSSARLLMTNSGKYAHYAPGLLGLDAIFGSTEECVASAVAGTVVLEEGPWAA